MRHHIKKITQRVRSRLIRQAETELLDRLTQRANMDPFAKAALVHMKRIHPGPPLHTALSWIGPPAYRAAAAALFGGELFLGRYAGNYFGKALLPRTSQQLTQLNALGMEASRVCLHCWHRDKSVYLEDEAHMLLDCPLYELQRHDLLNELTSSTTQNSRSASTSNDKLLTIMGSQSPADWQALGKFLARIRQIRRKVKTLMQRKAAQRIELDFYTCKAQWKREGKHVCRHGVFFDTGSSHNCLCMSPPAEADWCRAVLMPTLSEEFRCIVADTFCPHDVVRIGQLHAEMRRRNW